MILVRIELHPTTIGSIHQVYPPKTLYSGLLDKMVMYDKKTFAQSSLSSDCTITLMMVLEVGIKSRPDLKNYWGIMR